MKQALEDIVKLLEMNKVETSFTDVSDLLWLYSAMGGEAQSSEAVNNKETKEGKQESQRQDTSKNHNKEQEESSEDTEADNNRSSLHTNSDKKDGKSKGDYFKTPTRKQFNQFNQFATVFKILKQFSNSSSEQEFNENETIEYIANTNVWNIQTTPKKELKYTLFIVIEKSTSMRIWEEITQEFVSALSRFSFFKDVQVVYLKELDEKYQLYRDKQCNKKVSTKLFNSQTQRTLTILLSDCISKGWQDKRGYSFLDEVTAVTPFLIVNMLPQRVWNRTVVNDSWRVKFTHRDGWKNSSLVSDEEEDIKEEFGLEDDSKEDFIRVPMTTLEKIPLKHWSNVIAGYKNNWLHGSLFEAEVFDLDIPPKDEIKRTPSSSIAPEQQVKNFYAYASPLAHELAVYFSAVPILSIEIMKMIQKTSLPKTNHTHLAEVFLSGLLKKGEFKVNANDDTYIFKDGIKEVLSKRLPPQLKEKIQKSNSQFIKEHLGHLQEFQSIIESEVGSVDGISSNDDGFASVAKEGSKVLKKKTIPKPAVFKTVTEKIQVSPARTEWKKTTSDDPELIDVPAEYKMVTKEVMVTPEVEKEVEIHNVVISELLSIGWNKKNILQEYKLPSNKKVDILLRHNEKNLTLIEVKAPSFDVKSGLDQAILYGKELRVDYVYSTNGVEIYGYSIANEVGGIVTEYRSPNSMVTKWVKKVLLSELNQWKKSFENISLLSENIEFAQSVNNSKVLIHELIEIVNISEYEDLKPLFDAIDKLEKSKQSKEDNEFSDNPFEILTHELREINSFLYSLSSLVIYDDSKETINNLINNLNKILDIINKMDIYELEELLTRKNVISNSIEKFGLKPISYKNSDKVGYVSILLDNYSQTVKYINKYKELLIEEGIKNITNKNNSFDTLSLKQFKESILRDFDWILYYLNNMNESDHYPKDKSEKFYKSYCDFYTFLSDVTEEGFVLNELFLHIKDIYCKDVDIIDSLEETSSQLTIKLGRDSIVGREKELNEIDKLLNNSRILLLNGIGGIGKTTIASYYLNSQKDKFDYYGFFEGIESFISELRESLELKQEKQEDALIEALSKLRKLEGKKLLVIDDIKDVDENKKSIEQILELKNSGYKILLTSREKIEDVEQYYLDVLSMYDAKALFNSIYEVEDELLLEEILNYLDCNAFFVELTAKTLKSKKTLTPEIIKEKFGNGEFSTIKRKRKESFADYLNHLFSFDELDDEEILILKQFSILPSIKIEFEFLEAIFDRKDDDNFEEILNYLSEKGWLNSFDNGYKLSQITKEYIWTNYLSSFEEIEKIVNFFHNSKAKNLKNNIVYIESINTFLEKIGKINKFSHENVSNRVCDLCAISLSDEELFIDGKIKNMGESWGSLCLNCFEEQGIQIGKGKGQLYKKINSDKWLLLAGWDIVDDKVKTNQKIINLEEKSLIFKPLHKSKKKIFIEKYENNIYNFLTSHRPNSFESWEVSASWLPSDNNDATIVEYDGVKSVKIKNIYKLVDKKTYMINLEMLYEVGLELNVLKADYDALGESHSYAIVDDLNKHYVTVSIDVTLKVIGILFIKLDNSGTIKDSSYDLKIEDIEIQKEKNIGRNYRENDLSIASISNTAYTDYTKINSDESNMNKVPIKSTNTYSRNEIIEVEYINGIIKQGKYKKFEKDIVLKKCKVIDNQEYTLKESFTLEFITSIFDVSKEEENPINQGCYGQSLLLWLQGQLSKNVQMEDINFEDWGWYSLIKCENEKYMIGAMSYGEIDMQHKWFFFMQKEEKNFFQKIIGKKNIGNKCLVKVKDIFIKERNFEEIKIVYEGKF